MVSTLNYSPDYAVPPGATLKELLETKEMSQADFALRMGLTEKTVSQIINGAAPITYETASRLEMVLGIAARFWNAREAQYRDALLRAEEAQRLSAEKEWLKSLPVAELVKRGFITGDDDEVSRIRQCLAFFGVSTVSAWRSVWVQPQPQVQFRGADAQKKHPGYVATWLRIGELIGEKVQCRPYNAGAFRSALDKIRDLTIQSADVWRPRLRSLCAEAGVATVLVKEIPGAGVSGITKWLSKDKALILLSLKYKSDDQFWFTFFHESAHVLKHSKKLIFYEDGVNSKNQYEKEANDFAQSLLIPLQYREQLRKLNSKAAVRAFAESIGIAAGIVVGQMQYLGYLPMSHYYDLKRKYTWDD